MGLHFLIVGHYYLIITLSIQIWEENPYFLNIFNFSQLKLATLLPGRLTIFLYNICIWILNNKRHLFCFKTFLNQSPVGSVTTVLWFSTLERWLEYQCILIELECGAPSSETHTIHYCFSLGCFKKEYLTLASSCMQSRCSVDNNDWKFLTFSHKNCILWWN